MNRRPHESRLKNKSLDEITDQWASDVENYKREFQDSGSNIKKWDTILFEGRGKITRLVTESKEAERTQSIIDNALEQLESEQLDMEKLFDYYEAVLGEMEMESLGTLPTDVEREQMFNTIIKLSSKLTEMQTGAENLITSLNNLSLRVENSNTDSYVSPSFPVREFLTNISDPPRSFLQLLRSSTSISRSCSGLIPRLLLW